jgi:hypothetical protein
MSIFHANKFQRNLFYPVLVAFFIGCFVSWLCILYFIIGDFLYAPELYQFQGIIPMLLSAATVLMIVVVFWTFRMTGRYFGSYERVIKELDEVLVGQRKEAISTRQGDVMFEELLVRVNALIEKVQQ